MGLFDKIIEEKLLEDIREHLRPLQLSYHIDPLGYIIKEYLFNRTFKDQTFNITLRHYKRNIVKLELLTTKQGLEKERLVFNTIKNHLKTENFKITFPDITVRFLSYMLNRIVYE